MNSLILDVYLATDIFIDVAVGQKHTFARFRLLRDHSLDFILLLVAASAVRFYLPQIPHIHCLDLVVLLLAQRVVLAHRFGTDRNALFSRFSSALHTSLERRFDILSEFAVLIFGLGGLVDCMIFVRVCGFCVIDWLGFKFALFLGEILLGSFIGHT